MSIEFKRKLSGSETVEEPVKAPRPAPAYASRSYWEERYRLQFQKVLGKGLKVSDNDDGDVEPFAWYVVFVMTQGCVT